jgi:hypothetical protein
MIDLKEIFEIIKRLDSTFSGILNFYEFEGLSLSDVKNNLFNNLELIQNDYSFDLVDNGDNFNIEYNIYFSKDIIINIYINFLGSNGYLFFKYNDILLVDSNGVIIKDISNEFLKSIQ